MLSRFKNKKTLAFIVAGEILFGAWALVFIAWALWNRPLGPSLELVNPVSAQSAGLKSLPSMGVDLQSTATPTQTISGGSSIIDHLAAMLKPPPVRVKTVCGAPPAMTLLVVGSDQRELGYLYGLADSIRIVRVDFVNPGIMAVDVPRDLWVEIPGLADHGVTHGKINQAFFFGNPGMGYYDSPGEGPGLLARTLELNYGLTGIDHYVAMDMPTFSNIIDSLGGLEVYIDSYIDLNQGQDGANPDYVYPPGYYHLDGDRALMFARLRIPTIFQRARLQDILLRGLRDKLLNPAILPQLPGLFTQFSGSVLTDLSPKQVNQLACLAEKLTSENTHLVAFPDSIFTGQSTYDPYRGVSTYTLAVDNDLMRSYFSAFMQGTWPEN